MTIDMQYFVSTDLNAPVLTGQNGKLTDLLDACLVNGYTTASVTSITRSGTTATVTLAVANTTLAVGTYVLLAGAVETDYNGTFRITAIIDSTHFTFTVGGTPTTPATGTITYRKAPLGWGTAYTGTNKRAYRSADTGTNRFYLRVLDDGTPTGAAKEAWIRGYVAMTDIDTGSDLFPNAATLTNGLSWTKSSTADATARAWVLWGDGKTFYFRIANGGSTLPGGFGHFISLKPGDAFCTFIAGHANNSTSAIQVGLGNMLMSWNGGGLIGSQNYIARPFTQLGTPPFFWNNSLTPINVGSGANAVNTVMVVGGLTASTIEQYPTPVDQTLRFMPCLLLEYMPAIATPGFGFRGRLPGLYAPLHNLPLADLATAPANPALPGVTLMAVRSDGYSIGGSATGEMLVDITGPWT